jgi:hypothetical protein
MKNATRVSPDAGAALRALAEIIDAAGDDDRPENRSMALLTGAVGLGLMAVVAELAEVRDAVRLLAQRTNPRDPGDVY